MNNRESRPTARARAHACVNTCVKIPRARNSVSRNHLAVCVFVSARAGRGEPASGFHETFSTRTSCALLTWPGKSVKLPATGMQNYTPPPPIHPPSLSASSSRVFERAVSPRRLTFSLPDVQLAGTRSRKLHASATRRRVLWIMRLRLTKSAPACMHARARKNENSCTLPSRRCILRWHDHDPPCFDSTSDVRRS
jgi:hypothetical protein